MKVGGDISTEVMLVIGLFCCCGGGGDAAVYNTRWCTVREEQNRNVLVTVFGENTTKRSFATFARSYVIDSTLSGLSLSDCYGDGKVL